MVCTEHESSEEDVDVILPPRETGLKETWEEVVTYEYEYDKETGVKKIILKPKVIENRKTEFFSSVDKETASPSKRQTLDSEITEIEPESVIVYEYGEMISMYSDTTVSDIYLNNSLELGSSGAEGAYAGVERAIDIMVSQELRSAISEVTGQPVASVSNREMTANSMVTTEDCHDNQEPLPVHQSTVEIPTDIEIDTAQMTPNLKKAVELLRNKYNIVKMSREATPIPQELVEDSQLGEGCTINNEPLPQGTGYYVDDQMMDEVQEELETVMIELNKMDLARAVPLKSKAAHPKEGSWTETKVDRSGSESSDTDTLVETVPYATEKQRDGDRTDDTGNDDDDDDDETSGENMIFDMDDVFVKVVTTKDGRIKKIKILEGKEGGDTKKIVSPHTDRPFVAGDDEMAAASTEQSRVSDQQYFTKMFYQEDFLAGDEQYESGSGESDELSERRTESHEEGGKSESSEAELARHGDEHETGDSVTDSYFERISETAGSYYQDYDVRNLPDDHSTDSETSDEDDDDDEEYYEEDEERESPMRSLSPIAEEADGHEAGVVGLPSSSSSHQRQTITDSSEEDDEDEDQIEDSDGSVEVQRAERLSPQLIRQLSESQEDLEILKEFVRNAGCSPSEESDHNSCRLSPSVDRHSDVVSSVAQQHQQRATPTDGSGEQTSAVGKESITRLTTSQSLTSESTSSDPNVDSESDIITQKLALEGFLSSLGK
ncbi:hypothetical protein LSH36_640g01093 [Paralvinella palmiformis]|uniref:Uncharacterized protein n=1 Tax=Paralvinella palmiformis TaxID=53620 RepID=A0AAD9MUK0_9ANNE|nr:hypothetical protein LSH36_640g01093 [Paralvinella palmiformis]